MKTVYFVRHGESEINARLNTVCIPDQEATLTEKGIEQSRFIAKRAASLPIEAIIASPFVRTRDTAAMIAEETGVPVEYSDLLVERLIPSSFTGREAFSRETNEFFYMWAETFFVDNARVEDGENFADITERARKALALLDAYEASHILVVSHGFFLRALLAIVMFGDALTPREFRAVADGVRTDNTGLTVLVKAPLPHFDPEHSADRWQIRVFNDHAHLG